MSSKRKPKTGVSIGAGLGNPSPKTVGVSNPGRGGRQPKAAFIKPGPDAGEHKPTFSFHYADHAYIGSWTWPDGQDADELLRFLCEMGRLTWNEILGQLTGTGKRGSRHKKHHYQPVETLEIEARKRLAALRLDETFGDDIFRFRLGAEKRLWGFIVEGVFYVLWWDRNHKVYEVDRD